MVSLDDYPLLGCFRPRLTTIELPKYELGEILQFDCCSNTWKPSVREQKPSPCNRNCGF